MAVEHQIDQYCDGVNRRSFLQIGALGGLGLSLSTYLEQAAATTNKSPTNCILIWTRGGTSHHDTLDPKPHAPTRVRGAYAVLDTANP